MHCAAEYSKPEIVKVLIEYGCIPDQKDTLVIYEKWEVFGYQCFFYDQPLGSVVGGWQYECAAMKIKQDAQ